jgi:hypothetical protein
MTARPPGQDANRERRYSQYLRERPRIRRLRGANPPLSDEQLAQLVLLLQTGDAAKAGQA